MSFLGLLSRDRAVIERGWRMVGNTGSTFKTDIAHGASLLMSASGHDCSLTDDARVITAQGPGPSPDPSGPADDRHSTAIWNQDSDELRLYRARVGVPPIFYWKTDDSLAWSTSMRTLLQLGASKDIDRVALAQYQLSGFVQAPRTMVKSIRKLPAGHHLVWRSGTTSVSYDWAYEWEPKSPMDVDAQVEPVETLLSQSIQHAAESSGGRLALLLSGGIDSVCLAAVATKRANVDIEAFTFEYSDYAGKFNEAGPAAQVAESLGIPHEVIEITSEDLIEDFPRLVGEYEEPFSYGVHSAYMHRISERGIATAITGAVGATWALTGAVGMATQFSGFAPASLLEGAAKATAKLPGAGRLSKGLALAAMSDARRYFAMTQQVVIPDAYLEEMWHDAATVVEGREAQVESLQEAMPQGLDRTDIFAAFGLLSFGTEHLTWWSHRWAEAAGISIAFPYMEDAYIDFLGRLADREPNSPERRLIARQFLPEQTAYAPKTPQTLPLDVWLAGPLKDFARENLSREAIESEGTFDYNVLESRMRAHFAGQANHKWSIWTTLCYLIWKQEFLDQVAVTK